VLAVVVLPEFPLPLLLRTIGVASDADLGTAILATAAAPEKYQTKRISHQLDKDIQVLFLLG